MREMKAKKEYLKQIEADIAELEEEKRRLDERIENLSGERYRTKKKIRHNEPPTRAMVTALRKLAGGAVITPSRPGQSLDGERLHDSVYYGLRSRGCLRSTDRNDIRSPEAISDWGREVLARVDAKTKE